MKIKKPDHCAHVGAYNAHWAECFATHNISVAFGYLGHEPKHDMPARPLDAVRYMQKALAYLRTAIAYWKRAGGEVDADRTPEEPASIEHRIEECRI